MTDHGVELVTRALAAGTAPAFHPAERRPARPVDGPDLPASLRHWLAHDTALFDAGLPPVPRLPLGELVQQELGEPWGELFAPLSARFAACVLLPGGTDSRRVLALGRPDEAGESPVFAIDCDDLPFVGLMYPGFDVYAAVACGVVRTTPDGYLWPAGDDAYGPRARHHAAAWLGGSAFLQFPF